MVRDVFRLAKENAPAIIFIDEIDAIATKRFDAQTGGELVLQIECIHFTCYLIIMYTYTLIFYSYTVQVKRNLAIFAFFRCWTMPPSAVGHAAV